MNNNNKNNNNEVRPVLAFCVKIPFHNYYLSAGIGTGYLSLTERAFFYIKRTADKKTFLLVKKNTDSYLGALGRRPRTIREQ